MQKSFKNIKNKLIPTWNFFLKWMEVSMVCFYFILMLRTDPVIKAWETLEPMG